MENSTKEKILDAALVSFAENGYKGTNAGKIYKDAIEAYYQILKEKKMGKTKIDK